MCDAGATLLSLFLSACPLRISPYAFSFLPCIRAGAPAYTFFQRLANGHHSSFHSSPQVVVRQAASDPHDIRFRGVVAGASFFAGEAGAQGSASAPLPAPLSQERQGKRSWPTVSSVVFHGSFHAHRSRPRLRGPKCQGFFGFCSVGFWEENGAINRMKKLVAVALRVEVRHG